MVDVVRARGDTCEPTVVQMVWREGFLPRVFRQNLFRFCCAVHDCDTISRRLSEDIRGRRAARLIKHATSTLSHGLPLGLGRTDAGSSAGGCRSCVRSSRLFCNISQVSPMTSRVQHSYSNVNVEFSAALNGVSGKQRKVYLNEFDARRCRC